MSLVRTVRMRVPAGMAKPGPAIGQALGPLGINMMDFCKSFNAKTQHLLPDTPTPVVLSAFSNRTFEFVIKTPPTSWLLKRCAKIDKGAKMPGLEIVGSVGTKAIYEIAKIKARDQHLDWLPLDGIARSVASTALSMGLKIRDDMKAEDRAIAREQKAGKQ
ncbi:ribosomal protein L11 [Tribonema minus]|uniref:Large ribosomal subunit protein uL11m n=1 Tax=Tribonema minus TaxID=303371 RepID=A0A835Z8X1_9STRA|nr:ribosomal protein L11 [Tribonema minus]|eukprot:TRINITY_DN6319_c0_g1_i1.p1 TRINITY_DN6319_c0_g1~~TRINITY_DN6319_c0_g1_i1.p1  ORF type:complete len:180 (-),score=27.54 TRINITY_DN6319_c0_g1_i1:183-665(-)